MTGSVCLRALAVIVAIGSFAAAQPQSSRSAMPLEPISAIVEQFKSHTLVALGDNEAGVQGSDFRIKLVRDPRFAAVVNDIVVEFGNSRYQDLVDRFTRGEESYQNRCGMCGRIRLRSNTPGICPFTSSFSTPFGMLTPRCQSHGNFGCSSAIRPLNGRRSIP